MESKEIWRDCKGYEGKYQVSNLGRVWSIKRQQYLKPLEKSNGYYAVNLYATNGKMKTELVHRLVALAFLDNPNNFPQVNHIDENKKNNKADNLEWCSAEYNNGYGTRTTRANPSEIGKTYLGIAVNQLDATGAIVNTFRSLREASAQTGISRDRITRGLKQHKEIDGFMWEVR